MKIGIVGFIDKNNIPYMEYYEEVFKNSNIEYECIFWDRFNNCTTEKIGNEYIVHITCEPGINKIRKLIPMYKFKKEIEKIIDKEQYTHLVILTTIPSVLIHKKLIEKFKEKYILDIRDYSYEKYRWYRKILRKLIENSFFTAISSKGFLKFLGKSDKIIVCHNIGNKFPVFDKVDDLSKKEIITIGFVGGVRYFDENCKLINIFVNNEKYRLAYIGRRNMDCDLESYCKEHKINNVIFQGAFKNEDKPEIYKEIDLINAIYGNESLEVTTALPNRLYDGILFKKPIIASSGTYLGEIVKKHGIGIVVEQVDGTTMDIVENYLNDFDVKKFSEKCNKFLTEVIAEQDAYIKALNLFVVNTLSK